MLLLTAYLTMESMTYIRTAYANICIAIQILSEKQCIWHEDHSMKIMQMKTICEEKNNLKYLFERKENINNRKPLLPSKM